MPPLFEELGGQTGGSPAARVDAMNLPRLGFVEQREEVPANPSEGGLENREGEACRDNGVDRVSTLDHRFVSGDRGERVLAGHRELAGEEDPAQNHEAGTPLFPIRTLAALFPQAGTGSPQRLRTRSALSVIILLGSPTASREQGLSLSLYFRHHFRSL